MSVIWEINHEAHGQYANKAQGEAECLINIKTAHRVLYFTYI